MTHLPYWSAAFAFGAAILWFWSAMVRLPKHIESVDYGFIDQSKAKPIDDIDLLTLGLRRQSRLSALGAVAAAISATLQGISITV